VSGKIIFSLFVFSLTEKLPDDESAYCLSQRNIVVIASGTLMFLIHAYIERHRVLECSQSDAFRTGRLRECYPKTENTFALRCAYNSSFSICIDADRVSVLRCVS